WRKRILGLLFILHFQLLIANLQSQTVLPRTTSILADASSYDCSFARQIVTPMSDLSAKRERLLQLLGELPSCAVAFSAGVDSSVVAKAAQLALGAQAVAVTGVSNSLPAG